MADPTSKLCQEWANDIGKQRRVKHFMQKAAIDVIGEAGGTPGHAERLVYAKLVLDGTASVSEYAKGVVTNATISASIDSGVDPSDSDLEFTVNSMFNDFAGYDG